MKGRHTPLSLPPCEALLELLLVLLLGTQAMAVCPSVCSCNLNHTEVDCSSRSLIQLPVLQHNLVSLNLSLNRLSNLDRKLTIYTHLQILDLSNNNRLKKLPARLPHSLLHLRAIYNNNIQIVHKHDVDYLGNLRILDLSYDKLHQIMFINGTMNNLRVLDLSHNNLWILPINMPKILEVIDLSRNKLTVILPGSIDHLDRLTHLYLQNNRFHALFYGVLDKLTSLRVIDLGTNPWPCYICEINYTFSWIQNTSALVLGFPCPTKPDCTRRRYT